jgi:hypothetical protein
MSHTALPMTLHSELRDAWDDVEAARLAIRRAFDDPANQDPTRIGAIARWADRFGNRDLALAALRRDNVEMGGTTLHELWQPFETGLRTDPRFKQLIRDLGIYDYWRASGNWGDFARPKGDDDFEMIR